MRKIFLLMAACAISVATIAASITAPDVDFGTVSIKGETLPKYGSTTITVTWNGLSSEGVSMYAEISEGMLDDETNPNGFYVSDPAYVYLGYGGKMVSSCTFDIGYSVQAAGTYKGKLHLYSYDTGWNPVDAYADITITVTGDAVVAKTVPYERINSTGGLHSGDTIVFVCESAGAVSGPLNGAALQAVTEGVKINAENGKADVPAEAQTFVLNQYSGNWQFLYPEDKEKALLLDYDSNSGKGAFSTTYEAGKTVKSWEVSISEGVATVIRPNEADPAYPVRYNSERFKPYKSEGTGDDIAIYKKAGKAQEIQSRLTVTPNPIVFADCETGEEQSVEVTYTAENLTDDIIWAAEGTDAALFEVTDEGNRESGKVTITYKGTGTKTGAVEATLSYLTQNAQLDPMEGSFPISLTLTANTVKLTQIAFAGAPETIDQGESIDMSQYVVLTPDDAADKSLSWATDHDYQGTIDANGVLTAKHVTGNIVVTVTSVRVPEVSASHTLKITVPVVTDFTLSDSEVTLNIGGTHTLSVASYVPEYATAGATYASSNTDIATVNKKGVITAKALGDAEITATIGEVVKTCVVHVVPVTVSSIAFEPAETSMTTGATKQLQPTVLPAGAAEQYTISYSSDNEAVATVSEEGLVSAIAEGTAVITATIAGKSAQLTIHVSAAATFAKVTDASTLAAKDTIILATIYDGNGIVAGPRDGKKLTIAGEGVRVSATEAYAEDAVRFVLGTEKGKDGFTLTIVGGKTIAVNNDGNDILDANTKNNKFWEFVEDGTNGWFVRNLGNTNAMFKYLAGNKAIKPYKAATAGAVYVYAYVRKYVAPSPTGLEDVPSDKVQCTKVLRDGQLYIMYDGQMYDVQGQRVR